MAVSMSTHTDRRPTPGSLPAPSIRLLYCRNMVQCCYMNTLSRLTRTVRSFSHETTSHFEMLKPNTKKFQTAVEFLVYGKPCIWTCSWALEDQRIGHSQKPTRERQLRQWQLRFSYFLRDENMSQVDRPYNVHLYLSKSVIKDDEDFTFVAINSYKNALVLRIGF